METPANALCGREKKTVLETKPVKSRAAGGGEEEEGDEEGEMEGDRRGGRVRPAEGCLLFCFFSASFRLSYKRGL